MYFEIDQQLGLAILLDRGDEAEGLRALSDAISHELELSVGGNEGDGALGVKFAQTNTSVCDRHIQTISVPADQQHHTASHFTLPFQAMHTGKGEDTSKKHQHTSH